MELTLTITGLNELVQRMEAANSSIKSSMQAALKDSANHIKQNIQARAPGKIGETVDVKMTYPTAVVTVNAPYAAYVERGTGLFGPYNTVVQPTTKSVMATTEDPGWGAPNKKGYWIIGLYTRGQEAQPFFEPAVRDSLSYINERFQAVGDNLVVAIAGEK